MKKIWPYILMVVSGFGIYWLLPVNVTVDNKQVGYRFGVSRLLTNIFLVKQGYWNKVREIKVIYTPEKQDRMNLIDGQDMALVSNVGIDQKGKSLIISQYYNPDKIGQIITSKDWLNWDLLINICVDLAGKGVGIDGCQKKADDYLKWAARYRIDKIVTAGKKLTFRLVKPVYAGCSGTIKCGVLEQKCTCTQPTITCNRSGDCGDWGTCSCNELTCNTTIYPALHCNSANQTLCSIVSEADCTNGGECPNNQVCTWVPSCVPQCSGKECGDDGCGGSCGNCPANFHCNINGVCKADCNCSAPSVPALSSPGNGTNYYNFAGNLDLSWSAPADWGAECSEGDGRRYQVCWGANSSDPCNGGSVQTVTVPTATVFWNSIDTHYWKVTAYNDCSKTAGSAIWSVINNNQTKTCSISPSGLTLVGNVYVGTTGTTFDIAMSGNANSSSTNSINLWLEKTSETVINNYQTEVSPLTTYWTDGTIYNYHFDGSDLSTTNNDVSGNTAINIKQAGDYYLHCHLSTDPNKCTGHPKCSVNGGTVDCSGWASCSGIANARGGDNMELCITEADITCANSCGQARGCGMSACPNTDGGVPNTISIVDPNGTVGNPDSYPNATTTINLDWMADSTGKADNYLVEVYQNGIGSSKFSTTIVGLDVTNYNLNVGNSTTWDRDEDYFWKVRATNINCGIENGLYSVDGYFKFNSAPVIPTITPLPTAYPSGPVLPTPSLPPDYPPTLVPTPPSPYEPPQVPTLPPPTPLPVIIDINNNPVVPDMYGRNHTCEVDAGQNRIFASPNPADVGGQVSFSVTVTDADGGDDIANVWLRFDEKIHVMNLGVPSGNNVTATLTLNFGAGDTMPDARPIELKADDTSGATTEWLTTSRLLKVWDCNVPLSGTMYDSTTVGNAVCLTGVGFQIPVNSEANFRSVGVTQFLPTVEHDTIVVNSAPGSAYSSNNGPIFWGREYYIGPNPDVVVSGVISRWIDMGNGYTPINCGSQNQVIDDVVDPYASSPKLSVDFSGIIDQNPWYQISGGGAMSKSGSVIGMVPVTCQIQNDPLVCQWAISIDSPSIGLNNNGLLAAETNVTNSSGCVLPGTCLAGIPNNWYYNQNVVSNITYSYQYFYDNLFIKAGIGATISGPTSMNYLNNMPGGANGLILVNGDLVINENNTVSSGGFLMVVVNGKIDISANVDQVEGIFVSRDSIMTAGPGTNQLVVNGILYTYGAGAEVTLGRGFVNTTRNNLEPAVVVNYQPRFLFSMPSKMSQLVTGWKIIK